MEDQLDRILEYVQLALYEGRFSHQRHSEIRMGQRNISDDDVEAAIQSAEAEVTEWRQAEDTYTILGRRANGDMIKVVVAFNAPQLMDATRMRIVSVMHSGQGDV